MSDASRHSAGRSVRPSSSQPLFAAHSRLTERDRRILLALHEHDVLSSDQVARLFFTSLRTGQLRLGVLRELGLIDRFRHPRAGGGSEPWKWLLAWHGARLHAAAAAATPPSERAYRERMLRLAVRPDLGHLLAVNEFFVRLQHPVLAPASIAVSSAAAETAGLGRLRASLAAIHGAGHHNRPAAGESGHREGRLLRWWSEKTATARFAGIRPDGHGIWEPWDGLVPGPSSFRTEDGPAANASAAVGFWLECDTGTEPLARLVAKLDSYGRLARSGGPRYPVLFWLPSAARERHLHRLLRDQPPWASIPVATATHDAADPATAIWLPVGGLTRVRLGKLPSAHGLESASNPNWIRGHLDLGDQRHERD